MSSLYSSPPAVETSDLYELILAATSNLTNGVCPRCYQPAIQATTQNTQFAFTCRLCGFNVANGATMRQLVELVNNRLPLEAEITQGQLLAYDALSTFNSLKAAFRSRFLDLFDVGAGIQPGPLTLSVTDADRSIITRDVLEEVCGERMYQQILRTSMVSGRMVTIQAR